jgi:hypothetical protein
MRRSVLDAAQRELHAARDLIRQASAEKPADEVLRGKVDDALTRLEQLLQAKTESQ